MQQLGPSHYQDLQESDEALKAMRAQKEALEKDFGVLLADKHALEMQLSSSDEILAAEKDRSQQVCADRAEILQKLETLQAGMDHTSHLTNSAERAAAGLELVQHQIAQGLEQVNPGPRCLLWFFFCGLKETSFLGRVMYSCVDSVNNYKNPESK